jgi:hypothetical protein
LVELKIKKLNIAHLKNSEDKNHTRTNRKF